MDLPRKPWQAEGPTPGRWHSPPGHRALFRGPGWAGSALRSVGQSSQLLLGSPECSPPPQCSQARAPFSQERHQLPVRRSRQVKQSSVSHSTQHGGTSVPTTKASRIGPGSFLLVGKAHKLITLWGKKRATGGSSQQGHGKEGAGARPGSSQRQALHQLHLAPAPGPTTPGRELPARHITVQTLGWQAEGESWPASWAMATAT